MCVCGETSVRFCVVPMSCQTQHLRLRDGSWRRGVMKEEKEEEKESWCLAAKLGSCNTALLIAHTNTNTHTCINVLSAEWVASEGLSLSLLSSICGQITDIIGWKRDSLSTFFSLTLRRGPGMSLCTPAVEKEMKAKNVADVSPS